MKNYITFTLIGLITFLFGLENKFALDVDNSKLVFELGELQISNDKSFSNIKSEGFGSISLNGVPDLPIFSTMYQLTPGKQININYNVIESQIIENVNLKSFNNNFESNLKYVQWR